MTHPFIQVFMFIAVVTAMGGIRAFVANHINVVITFWVIEVNPLQVSFHVITIVRCINLLYCLHEIDALKLLSKVVPGGRCWRKED